VYRNLVAILTCCAVSALAARPVSRPVHPLAVQQTKYRMRAGAFVQVAAPRETLDFIRNARSSGVSVQGFVVGTNWMGDQMVLAASLTTRPGEYTLKISATSQTGEERAMTLDVTLEPIQIAPLIAATPPVALLNGEEPQVVLSTPGLVEQGWVVPGSFEPIHRPIWEDVQSRLILDGGQ
jgi:hypothetical protein